jgi:hypothetical protein
MSLHAIQLLEARLAAKWEALLAESTPEERAAMEKLRADYELHMQEATARDWLGLK